MVRARRMSNMVRAAMVGMNEVNLTLHPTPIHECLYVCQLEINGDPTITPSWEYVRHGPNATQHIEVIAEVKEVTDEAT